LFFFVFACLCVLEGVWGGGGGGRGGKGEEEKVVWVCKFIRKFVCIYTRR